MKYIYQHFFIISTLNSTEIPKNYGKSLKKEKKILFSFIKTDLQNYICTASSWLTKPASICQA